MRFTRFAEWVAIAIEGAGIGVIAVAAVLASGLFVYRLAQKADFAAAYERYRQNLGRGILLGLEFLVAADIINTVVVELTFRSLGVLGLIVVIRTFLSFTLELEVHGRWPWEKDREAQPARP